jgi:hypothetical protein
LADEDGAVVLDEGADALVAAEGADEVAAFLFGVADCAEDAEEVEAGDGVFVGEFLFGALEDFGCGEGCCDWWG